MKYLAMLKNQQTTYRDALPKQPKTPFDTFGSECKRHVSKSVSAHGGARYDDAIRGVIDELNRRGAVVDGVPLSARREALRLEAEIHDAAMADDEARFQEALHLWRDVWARSLH